MLELPFLVLAGMLGASAASFGQCVISRTREGRSWISGRSICDHCRHQLTWHENLPILSFLLQGGKTRCCHKKLSPAYVIGESITAAITVFLTAMWV